jgi:putative FmdB family regulatory protein
VPIYEYECGKCKRHFEFIEKMGASAAKKCEKCGGKLTRLISPAGFQLKGTGWYKTDYAPKPSGSEGGGSESGDTKKKPAKDDGKKE